MQAPSFQRAREPEQKEQRRRALLDAAAALLADGDLEAVTLSAIARAVGLAKSNVYRYFESREEILLELLVDDEVAWVGELEQALGPGRQRRRRPGGRGGRRHDRAPSADLRADLGGGGRPRAQPVGDQRGRLQGPRARGLAPHPQRAPRRAAVAAPRPRRGPAPLPPRPGGGLWPMAHPAPPTASVLARPEFHGMCSQFDVDLRGALAAMLRGLMAPAGATTRRATTRRAPASHRR
ncbi:MAG: TetR family transcriptional regulator [Kofleriaceae bacterium]|nr:TetR family transcriptional regulator [Kofleriaceae bacterium]